MYKKISGHIYEIIDESHIVLINNVNHYYLGIRHIFNNSNLGQYIECFVTERNHISKIIKANKGKFKLINYEELINDISENYLYLTFFKNLDDNFIYEFSIDLSVFKNIKINDRYNISSIPFF